MASSLMNSIKARPILVSAVIAGATGAVYLSSSRKVMLLDSAHAAAAPASKAFSFPSSMLVSRQLTVTDVQQINHDTKRIIFALPGGPHEVSGVPAGSAVLTQHWPSGRIFPVLRPYTPVQSAESTGVLEFIVKKYPGGAASTHLHSLEKGSKLTVRGPIPGYTWKASQEPRDVLFVAGGAGITPLFSLMQSIVTDQMDRTRIHLVWGVNGTRDIVVKDQLEALEEQYPQKLRVTYVVSGPEGKADAPSLGDAKKWRKGYIDQSLLQESIQRLSQSSSGSKFGDEKGTKVFFCGPPSMQSAITGRSGILSHLGVDKQSTHIF